MRIITYLIKSISFQCKSRYWIKNNSMYIQSVCIPKPHDYLNLIIHNWTYNKHNKIAGHKKKSETASEKKNTIFILIIPFKIIIRINMVNCKNILIVSWYSQCNYKEYNNILYISKWLFCKSFQLCINFDLIIWHITHMSFISIDFWYIEFNNFLYQLGLYINIL